MKKALIVTYYWPPAGGPGVQRWLKFTKYLPEFGIQPIVYTPENPSYPILDESLNRDVSNKVEVIKHPITEPHSLGKKLLKKEIKSMSSGIIVEDAKQSRMQKLMLYVRGNYFIPDARVFWVNPSIKFLKKYLSEHAVQTIITTGPPHSLHLIGQGLKEQFPNLKWIADFRDPWVNIDYHSQLRLTKKSEEKHRALELAVLQEADQIWVTSYQTKEEFSQKTKQPIDVITNGYDEVDVTEVDISEAFSLVHVGSLMSERNPTILWEIFAEMIEEDKRFKQFFEMHLVGKVSQAVLDSLEAFGLKEYVYLDGYLPHLKAVKAQHQAQLLLLIEANRNDKKGIIPGKLFEYLMAKRPLLAIGPEEWDVKKIVDQTQAGHCFSYSEKNQLKKQIQDYFNAFLQGKLNVKSTGITRFSRKALAEKISGFIE